MFDRIVGGFAEGLGNGIVSLIIAFPMALLIAKLGFSLPQKSKHGYIAFGIAWVAVACIYVVFHFHTQGPQSLISQFVIPWIISLLAIFITGWKFRSKAVTELDTPKGKDFSS